MTWPGYENYVPPHRGATVKAVKRAGPAKVARVEVDDAVKFACRALKLPEPVTEFRFHPSRKWAFDWAWVDVRVALEQEGIVYPTARGDHRLSGRHVSVSGFTADIEKYGEAFRLGWRVLRCLPEQITNGQAALWLEPILRTEKEGGRDCLIWVTQPVATICGGIKRGVSGDPAIPPHGAGGRARKESLPRVSAPEQQQPDASD